MNKFDFYIGKKELEIKLKEDIYYNLFFNKGNMPLSVLYDSGYFLSSYKGREDLLIDYKLNKRTTYLFDKDKLSKSETNYFLLSCGGFSPVHEGHLEMMYKAKRKLEDDGKYVVGGYISPSHDDYVSEKRNGEASLNIYKRIDLLEKAVMDIDWLYIDKWESCECRYEVNYTIVIERLQTYLNSYYKGFDIEVVFVYGSDNKVFGEVLEVSNKLNVCVLRNEDDILNNDLIYQYKVTDYILNVSSKYKRNKGLFVETDYNVKGIYEVREDSKESLIYLKDYLTEEKTNKVKEDILNLLKRSISSNLEIKELKVSEQKEKLNEKLREDFFNNIGKISLDVYVKEGYEKGVSRVFKLSEGQEKAHGLIGRNGEESIKEYLKDISKGDYLVIDDDTASGYTFESIKKGVSDEVNILGFLGLNDLVRDEGTESFDVVDIRDFIVGSEEGGLCVEIEKGKYCRVPYIEPYVNVLRRASILPEKVKMFTEELWLINYNLYRDSGVKLDNLPEKNKLLFLEEGYKSDTLLENILFDKIGCFTSNKSTYY